MSQIIQSRIQTWGNGLGLRVSGLMRSIPNLAKDTPVEIIIVDNGFDVRVKQSKPKAFTYPIKESDLLRDMTPDLAHADELADLQSGEY